MAQLEEYLPPSLMTSAHEIPGDEGTSYSQGLSSDLQTHTVLGTHKYVLKD